MVDVLAWTGGLSWFGRLPGDIRMERGNARVYIPLVSMLIVSVVVSIVLSLFRRWRSLAGPGPPGDGGPVFVPRHRSPRGHRISTSRAIRFSTGGWVMNSAVHEPRPASG